MRLISQGGRRTAMAALVLAGCRVQLERRQRGRRERRRRRRSAVLTPVKFQLQWVAQSQFAGYYAALDQGYYRDAGLDVSLLLGGPNINNVQVVATGGADIGTAWLPNMLQSREGGTDLVVDRPDLPALGHPDGLVQGGQHHHAGEHGRQEDRQLAGRQRAGAVRGADQGGARPDQGEHHQAELRHVGAAQGRPRRRPGDDLQRVRPGPRGQEPGDRPAVHAGRPQRRRLQRPGRRHGDAPGPDLRDRQVAQDRQQRRHRHQVPAGHVQGLDLLPRQRPEVRRHRPRQGLAARRQPPGLADERDQRAHLAVAERASACSTRRSTTRRSRSRPRTRSSRRPRPPTATRTDLAQKALDALGTSVDTKGASFAKGTVTLKEGGN